MIESWVTFDRPDGWAKEWILSNSDVTVDKRRQQEGGSVVIWTGIVNQTVIEPFKVDERVYPNGFSSFFSI